VAEDTGLLFVEIVAFGVAELIDLINDHIKIGFNIINYFIDFIDSLGDFTILNFTYLNHVDTGLLDGLNMAVTDLLDVGDQLGIIVDECLFLT
jgi:hypothetical protein